jgi:ABC-2 type transport system ATP-binding protein
MSDYAIETDEAVMKFGDFTAVDSVSLKIKKGEIFGLLGPNGAGKSTTINMLLGLLKPTSGGVFVNGIDMQRDPNRAKKTVGVVTQETVVEPELTAEQNLEIFGNLYHVPKEKLRKKIDFLLDLADLKNFRKSYAGTFSGGMKRRLETVKALVHDPDILFLDEPTTGLDIQNRTRMWQLLREINRERNVTILMTTQYLEEADQMCNRIAIIDHGKLIAMGTPAELRQKIGLDNIIEIAADKEDLQKVEQVFKKLGLAPQVLSNKVISSVKGNAVKKIEELIKAITARGVKIQSVSLHEPTIDDVFLKLTGSSVRDATGDYAGRSMMRLRGR